MSSVSNLGRLIGDVKVVWERDTNDMILLEDFSYLSPEDLEGNAREYLWTAPKGAKTDGASIPQIFWTFGHPFEAPYRAAAVLHDHECRVRQRPWPAVHKMFYLACLCGGVNPSKAKLMYWAVSNYGPEGGSYQDRDVPLARIDYLVPAGEGAEQIDGSSLRMPTLSEIHSIQQQLEASDIPVEVVPGLKP